jgi:hypothetical protein
MRFGLFHILALGLAAAACVEWLVFNSVRVGLLMLVLAAAMALGQALWRASRM